MTMGSSGGCTSGQVDRFSSNHTVTIRECKAGHVVSTSETWRVSTDGDADTFLTIGNQRYHLFFKNRDGAEFMRLEIRPNVKTEIKDYDFKLTQSGTDK